LLGTGAHALGAAEEVAAAGVPETPLLAQPAVDAFDVAHELPPPHLVAAGDDAGTDALGDPGPVHVVADAGSDPEQVTALDAEALSVLRVDPDRVGVGELAQPLGVGGVWISVGRRKVDTRTNSFLERSSLLSSTWLSM